MSNKVNKIRCIDCDKETIVGTTGKRCNECYKISVKTADSTHSKARTIAKKNEMVKECLFCKSVKKPELHHIDKNQGNNELSNLVYLCFSCHKKLHGKIYNQIFKRFFAILKDQRFTMEDIGKMFNTTRQNVNQIMKG